MYQRLSSLLQVNFAFSLASSVENFGGAEGYPPQLVEKECVNLCVLRTFKFVGTRILFFTSFKSGKFERCSEIPSCYFDLKGSKPSSTK